MSINLGTLKKKLLYWINCPFNISNQLNDLSGNGRTFSTYGGGLSVGTTYDAAGALEFSTSAFITTNDVLRFNADDFEISCEIYITSSSDFYSVFLAQRTNSLTSVMEFYSLSDGRLLVNIYFSDGSGVGIAGTAVRNQWQSIKLKRVGTTFTLTVDGVDTTYTSSKTIRSSSSGIFNIGSANAGSPSGNPTGAIRKLKITV